MQGNVMLVHVECHLLKKPFFVVSYFTIITILLTSDVIYLLISLHVCARYR